MTKTIAFNVLIFLALMFLLMLAPPTFFAVKNYFRPLTSEIYAQTARKPVFRDYEWAQQSLWETRLVQIQYRDFVNFRGTDFAGEAINVENGIRRTIGVPQNGEESPVWFFGGSTTWGTGVSDAYTYPSMFAQQTGRDVTNFGERGYTSHQSLAYLQELYLVDPKGNRTVVFYDGVNDLMNGCHPQTSSVYQSAIEQRFRGGLRHLDNPFTYQRLFEQLTEFVPQVTDRLGLTRPDTLDYRCSEDPEHAQVVADGLVTVLTRAQTIVEANGDRFIAVLQPASFLSANVHPVLPANPYNEKLLAEYQVTYPLMQEALANSDINYVDLSHIYDDCQDCYYDHVHAGPAGHQRLVDALVGIVP